MPSSFARHAEAESKFNELVTLLNQMMPPGRGEPARKWAAMLAKVEEARAEFEALGGPQSGSSG